MERSFNVNNFHIQTFFLNYKYDNKRAVSADALALKLSCTMLAVHWLPVFLSKYNRDQFYVTTAIISWVPIVHNDKSNANRVAKIE